MEIRFCKTEDVPALSALWKTVFGDADAYIAAFFSELFEPNQSVLASEDGHIVAMAHAITIGEIELAGKYYPVTELYAVATAEEYRGRGVAACLIEKILAATKETYQTVKPAEESLFAYYARFGYEPVFSEYRTVKLSGEGKPISAAAYGMLREEYLQGTPHIRHSLKAIAYQEHVSTLLGGEFLQFPGGIAAIESAGEKQQVPEILPLKEKTDAPFAMAIPRNGEKGLYFGFAFE